MSEQAIVSPGFHHADDVSGDNSRLPLLLFFVVVGVVVWIAAAPFIMLLYSSLSAEADKLPFESAHLSLDNYIALLTDSRNLALLGTTAAFTTGSTVIGVGLAIFFAWLIERTELTGRSLPQAKNGARR